MADHGFARRRSAQGQTSTTDSGKKTGSRPTGHSESAADTQRRRTPRSKPAKKDMVAPWLPAGVSVGLVRGLGTAGLVMGLVQCMLGMSWETELRVAGGVGVLWLTAFVVARPARPLVSALCVALMSAFYNALALVLLYDWYCLTNPWFPARTKEWPRLQAQTARVALCAVETLPVAVVVGLAGMLMAALSGSKTEEAPCTSGEERQRGGRHAGKGKKKA